MLLLCLAALAVAIAGPGLLRWRDDIRLLEIPAPGLRENDQAIRRLFGEGHGRTVYLTRGGSPAEAREAWARFATWHATTHPETPLFSLAFAVPDEAQWLGLAASRETLSTFEADFREALQARNYDPEAFAPFFQSWQRWVSQPRVSHGEVLETCFSGLKGPFSLMVSSAPDRSLFLSVAMHPYDGEPPEGLDTVSTEQLVSLNRVFTQYRLSAMNLSLLGLGLLGLSVLLMYGLRRGARVFSIPLVACFFSFGLLGLLGQSMNLFHLLGAFLGVCLSHNYAIFMTENRLRGDGIPPSIRLSALSTAASFGVLAISRIPVVAALGGSVSLIVITALLIIELDSFLPHWLRGSTPAVDVDSSDLNPPTHVARN